EVEIELEQFAGRESVGAICGDLPGREVRCHSCSLIYLEGDTGIILPPTRRTSRSRPDFLRLMTCWRVRPSLAAMAKSSKGNEFHMAANSSAENSSVFAI